MPIKVPQEANNLIQWLKWLETYKDTCKHKKTKKNTKKQENIFMFSDCTARSEPIKYHHNWYKSMTVTLNIYWSWFGWFQTVFYFFFHFIIHNEFPSFVYFVIYPLFAGWLCVSSCGMQAINTEENILLQC